MICPDCQIGLAPAKFPYTEPRQKCPTCSGTGWICPNCGEHGGDCECDDPPTAKGTA